MFHGIDFIIAIVFVGNFVLCSGVGGFVTVIPVVPVTFANKFM